MAQGFMEWLSPTKLVFRVGASNLLSLDFDNLTVAIKPCTPEDLTKLHALTAEAAAINLLTQGVAAGYKVARGQHTMLSASDTVVTGLATVVAIVASMDSDPILTCDRCTASIGDQSAAPVAGSVYLKAWMPTADALTTPIAATGYANIKVNWIAVGT
jgi:hypothetical protein